MRDLTRPDADSTGAGKLRVRGYGTMSVPAAQVVAALIRTHDRPHTPQRRRELRTKIERHLCAPPSKSLNIARQVDRALREAGVLIQ